MGWSCCTAQSTERVCVMPQQTPARVCLGDFPDEILSLIFSHVDTATLLGAVPNVCRGWRAACGDDVYGPKVRLELRSILQVLRILPECVGLWVAATVGRFAWVVGLDLSKCSVEDGVLECARTLQRMTSLDVSSVYGCPGKITDMGLQHVAVLTQLTNLNLGYCDMITDTGLEHVAQLMQLTSLDLSGRKKITDTGLEHVAQLMQLTRLNLGSGYECEITDTGLEHLAQLTQLTSLDLSGCDQITDAGLEHVAQLTQLTSLDVSSVYGCPSKITDTGLQHVAALTQLANLNLGHCGMITDTGLGNFAQLTQLTSLNLQWFGMITATGLEHFA